MKTYKLFYQFLPGWSHGHYPIYSFKFEGNYLEHYFQECKEREKGDLKDVLRMISNLEVDDV